jgi:hypothetical protein
MWRSQILFQSFGFDVIRRPIDRRIGSPKITIGVDISPGALKIAQEVGYTPFLSDAQHLRISIGI